MLEGSPSVHAIHSGKDDFSLQGYGRTRSESTSRCNIVDTSPDTIHLERLKKEHIAPLLDPANANPSDPGQFVAISGTRILLYALAKIQDVMPQQHYLRVDAILHEGGPIGLVGLAGSGDAKHVGIWLVPAKRKGGFGTIAGRKAVKKAFESNPSLKSVIAFAESGNDGSIILQEDLGFRPDPELKRFGDLIGWQAQSLSREDAALAELAQWPSLRGGRRHQLYQRKVRVEQSIAIVKAARHDEALSDSTSSGAAD